MSHFFWKQLFGTTQIHGIMLKWIMKEEKNQFVHDLNPSQHTLCVPMEL